MIKLSRDEYINIFSNLPENVQDALLSLETVDIIHDVASKNKLDDSAVSFITEIIGDLLMDLVNDADFQKDIETNINISSVPAAQIAQELIQRIVAPLRGEIVDKIESLRPVFSTEKNKESGSNSPLPVIKNHSQETPFILHNEEEVEPMKETSSQPLSERPIFYKPTFSEEYKKSVLEKEAVSIELGEETEKKKQPESFKTPVKEVRVVHYSEFRTPLGPFENQGAREPNKITPEKEPQSAQSKTQDVHPNNVVDLKDLPLE